MNRRNLFIFLTVFLLAVVTVLVILLARGYQLDLKTAKLAPTGILVVTSDPDGAQVYINGKLTTATNNTINLAPGKYSVKIAKEGFTPWEKQVAIKPEEVFKTSAYLFPNLPELRPLTLTGAKNPSLSPDNTKVTYTVSSASAERNGVWIVDMSRPSLPAGIFSAAADFRQIYQSTSTLPLSDTTFLWSPDGKEVIASTSSRVNYLLETDRINLAPTLLSPTLLTQTLTPWRQLEDTRYQAQISKLPVALGLTLASSAAKLQFSPDENKIFYQATAAAMVPTTLTTYLPGTNPTPEVRTIQPGNFYVYDLKEDRNYEIENCKLKTVTCVWFPSSRHLLVYSKTEIAVMESDGTNRSLIYAGPFSPGVVFSWPNWSKIVILTSLNSPAGVGENLYTINLR
ncbi:PEGA domain-containing protein [Candidatus Microgenomates bacterium]|nr:PEGA domain-containing protein [Candidatus Microgenomates bacterium]